MEQTTANFETRWRRHTKRMRRDRKLRAAEEEEWGDVTTHTSGGCQGSCAGARGRFVGQFHRNCSIDTDDELFEEECDELQIDWRAALRAAILSRFRPRAWRMDSGTRHLPDLGGAESRAPGLLRRAAATSRAGTTANGRRGRARIRRRRHQAGYPGAASPRSHTDWA